MRRLGKAYPRIPDDLEKVKEAIKSGDFIGDPIPGFSCWVYKVRVPSSDMKRGKRGGFRVIYYVVPENRMVYFLTVYAKARQENVDRAIIDQWIDTLTPAKFPEG